MELVENQALNTAIVLVPNSIRVYWPTPSAIAYLPWVPGTGAVEAQLRTETVISGATLRLVATDETGMLTLLDTPITSSGFQTYNLTLPAQPSRVSISLFREGGGADPVVYGMMYTVPVPPQ